MGRGLVLTQSSHLRGAAVAWKFLMRLRDTAATFLFAGSTRSKAEHPSQRHMDTHRTLARLATDKALPSTARTCGTHTNTSTDSQVPSSSSPGRDRRSLVRHTRHSPDSPALARFTSTHFTDPLSTSTAPLSAWHPCRDPSPAACLRGPPARHLVEPDAR